MGWNWLKGLRRRLNNGVSEWTAEGDKQIGFS